MNDQEILTPPVEHLEHQIEMLNSKMDRILEELEVQRQRHMAIEDLGSDLMRVGNDAYKAAMDGLEVYAETVNGKELQQLVWNLARNLQSINKVVLEMESGMMFLEDVSPIVRQIIIDMTARLDEWNRKGYFANMQTGYREMGRILESLDEREIHAAGEKLAGLFENLRSIDWSRVSSEKVGFMTLFQELKSPEVKKGLMLFLMVLKGMGKQPDLNKITADENISK